MNYTPLETLRKIECDDKTIQRVQEGIERTSKRNESDAYQYQQDVE